MDILKNTNYVQTTSKQTVSDQSTVGDMRWKKGQDQGQGPSELSRIITDNATGKCYCRGKVLGKVLTIYAYSSA